MPPPSPLSPSPSKSGKFSDAAAKMTHLCRRIVAGRFPHFAWNFRHQVFCFRSFFRFIIDRILVCSFNLAKPAGNLHRRRSGNDSHLRYRRLSSCRRRTAPEVEEGVELIGKDESVSSEFDSHSDLVPLKISLLGDCQIGKTSFVVGSVRRFKPDMS